VTEVHRKIITEEKVAVSKKEETPPKRGIEYFRARQEKSCFRILIYIYNV